MRHHDVIGIAAIGKDAEAFHGAAEILLAAPARPARTAADPRIRNHARADRHAFGVRSNRHHLADILMPERQRQLHAAVGEAEPFAAAEIEPTVGEMQVAVADARRQHFEQHFAAGRLRHRLLFGLQRLAADAELKHAHRSPLESHYLFEVSTKRIAVPKFFSGASTARLSILGKSASTPIVWHASVNAARWGPSCGCGAGRPNARSNAAARARTIVPMRVCRRVTDGSSLTALAPVMVCMKPARSGAASPTIQTSCTRCAP